MVIPDNHSWDCGLSQKELFVLSWSADMPFSSRTDLADLAIIDVLFAYRLLQSLLTKGLVNSMRLSANRDLGELYFLTQMGRTVLFNGIEAQIPWSCTTKGYSSLVRRLELVEQLNRFAPGLLNPAHVTVADPAAVGLNDWRITQFRWLAGGTPHALARYGNNVWIAFVWVGRQANARIIREKWSDRFQNRDVTYWTGIAPQADPPRPSGWLVVAADDWAAELARTHFGSDDPTVRVVKVQDRVRGGWPLRPSLGMVDDSVGQTRPGDLDKAAKRIFADRGTVGIRGRLAARVFACVEEWPDIPASNVASMCGVFTKDVAPILEQYVNRELMVHQSGGYRMGRSGMVRAARNDRIHETTIYDRFNYLLNPVGQHRQRTKRHQRGLINLVVNLVKQGVPVAAGWRAVLVGPGDLQIEPDAVVRLTDGPLGGGWHYMEYERSATTPQRVADKLAPYLKRAKAGEPVPLLMVCQNTRTERLFWEAAIQSIGPQFPMLTSSYLVAKRDTFGKGVRVWRYYGKPVILCTTPDV